MCAFFVVQMDQNKLPLGIASERVNVCNNVVEHIKIAHSEIF